MNRQNTTLYEFGPFRFDTLSLALVKDGQPVKLRPQLLDLLLVFLASNGNLVSKDDLVKRAWPNTFVEAATVSRAVSRLKNALGQEKNGSCYIETVPKLGYRFVAHVRIIKDQDLELSADRAADNVTEEVTLGPSHGARIFGRHFWFAVSACILYAGLYAIAALVEVAYEFDRYGAPGVKIALVAFPWILATSIGGLAADWRFARQNPPVGFAICALIFLAGPAALYALSLLLLPAEPITKASFNTYTAQAAYLKTIFYFIALALLFLITPFHFVVALHSEIKANRGAVRDLLAEGEGGFRLRVRGAFYISARLLSVLLLVAAIVVFVAWNYLFSQLQPSPYKNLFQQLYELRIILYFALALVCLVWYHRALGELRLDSSSVLTRGLRRSGEVCQ
jgi:DNA-binding winged helix-turn-helix (wHTH) protein